MENLRDENRPVYAQGIDTNMYCPFSIEIHEGEDVMRITMDI